RKNRPANQIANLVPPSPARYIRPMRQSVLLLMAAMAWSCAKTQGDAARLVTGKDISPSAPGQDVGSLPMNMIATPDGQFALTTDMGFRQSLCTLRLSDGKRV